MSELGPVSQAILEYMSLNPWFIEFFRMIDQVARLTGAKHTNHWYFRRLMALALEGHIEAVLSRNGDELVFQFRRLQKAGGLRPSIPTPTPEESNGD